MIDNNLLQYCTPRQAEILAAIVEHGTGRKAAEALGVHHSAVNRALQSVKQKAALAGYAPDADMTKQVPSPFQVKGISTNYGKDGEIRQQWVKTQLDKDSVATAIQLFAQELTEDIRGVALPSEVPSLIEKDLLCVYPMGDPHIGMYAWADEAGEDFDTAIAERDIESAVRRLVASAPAAETAVVLNLGDFIHADNSSNMTSRSGNPLDVDTRWARVMQVGARIMIKTVKYALAKHQRVIVRNVIGNHDDHSSLALSLILDAYFENEPRVHISLNPGQVWYLRHGKVLIGSHHGHNIKAKDLGGVMAFDRKEDWAKSDYRYWYLGHVHHSESNEYHGVAVEYFRTLAARDAYTQGAGYRSYRDMRCIVLHKEWGEIERHTMDIRRVREE